MKKNKLISVPFEDRSVKPRQSHVEKLFFLRNVKKFRRWVMTTSVSVARRHKAETFCNSNNSKHLQLWEFSVHDLLEIKEMASNVRAVSSDSSSGPSEGEPECPLDQTIAIPNQGGSPTSRPNPRAASIMESRRQLSESFTSGEDRAEQMQKLRKLTSFIMKAYYKRVDEALMCDSDETAYFRNVVPVELCLRGGLHTYMAYYRKKTTSHGSPTGVRGRNWDVDIKCNYLQEVADHPMVEWFRIEKDSGRIHIKLDFSNKEIYRPKSIRVWISAVPTKCRGISIWGAAHCWEAGIDEGTNIGAVMTLQEDWDWRMESGASVAAPPSPPSGHNVDTWIPIGLDYAAEHGWDSIPSTSRGTPTLSRGNTTMVSNTTAGSDTQDTIPASDLPLVSQLDQQRSSNPGPSFASFREGQPLQRSSSREDSQGPETPKRKKRKTKAVVEGEGPVTRSASREGSPSSSASGSQAGSPKAKKAKKGGALKKK